MERTFYYCAVFLLALSFAAPVRAGAMKFSAHGNYCTHSSGGSFSSDADGGIGNASTTEAMIVHCPIFLSGNATGWVYALDLSGTESIACSVEGRAIITGGSGHGSNLRVSVLARASTGSASGARWLNLSATADPDNRDPPRFFITSLGWAYLRCVIPPDTGAGRSAVKGYYFINFGY